MKDELRFSRSVDIPGYIVFQALGTLVYSVCIQTQKSSTPYMYEIPVDA